MSEQPAERKIEVQVASIWGQNHNLEGLGGVFETKNPAWCGQRGPKVDLRQFRPSILGSFWGTFWKTLDTKTVSKDEVWFIYIVGTEIWSKTGGLGTKYEPSRILNNSASVLKYFSLLGNTSLLGFGSKNRLWNQAGDRYEFEMLLGSILVAKIIQHRIQNRLMNDVGYVVISGTIFTRSWGSIGRSDHTQNDVSGGWNQRREYQCHTPCKPHFMG